MRRDRRALAGVLLAVMLALSIAHGLAGAPTAWLAGLAAWAAAALVWPDLGAGQRRQCVVLAGVGLAGVAYARVHGIAVPWARLLDENEIIIALIAGISFVHLAGHGAAKPEAATPRGPRAFLQTLVGLNVLGAAINITALMLVSDHISARRRLSDFEIAALARIFSLAVLYSPFIGGMALALNHAPHASLAKVAAVGVVLNACGIAFTYLAARRRMPETLAGFAGYPLRVDVIWLPATLAAAVIGWRLADPSVPVLTATALLAPLIAWAALARRVGAGHASARAAGHVRRRLAGMQGELSLFLGAGVLAVGLSSAFAAAGVALPSHQHPGATASAALLGVALAAAAGLHPIITLTAVVPLLAPLHLSPETLVILFVCGWSLGCTLCPFSGTNLVLQGRHTISPWRFPVESAAYALFMWALASVVLVAESGF